MNYLAKARKEKEQRTAADAVDCSESEDMCRPEWAQEADINTIGNRILQGIPPEMKRGQYMAVDTTMDLQEVYSLADRLEGIYNRLSPETRSELTPEAFMTKALQGELELLLNPPSVKTEEPPKGE